MNWLLRKLLGEEVAHSLTCDACFERMMHDFIESLR